MEWRALKLEKRLLDELQDKLEYTFGNPQHLVNALTHSSYTQGRNLPSNERLEFLGDSLLGMTIAELIFHAKPNLSEGKMTKLRADLVCERSLAIIATELDLGAYILLGQGEIMSDGHKKPSILSDALEATFAAVYLDGGFEPLKELIEKLFFERLDKPAQKDVDYKSKLQEYIQRDPDQTIVYSIINEQGPDHDKHFTVGLFINDKQVSTGTGRSKKIAQQNAAQKAMEILK